MGEAIVITSGKGGVGKTTTTANIGTALALMGKSVCIADMDIGLRNLDVTLGLENRILYDIVDVAEGRVELRKALIKDKRVESMYLLAASQTRDKDALQEDKVREIVNHLKSTFDYVLLDCPAGIEQGFTNAVAGADRAIIVVTPDLASIRDADRVIGLLEKNSMSRLDLVVNRVKTIMIGSQDVIDIDEIVAVLAIELIGVVPDEQEVLTANNKGEPIALSAANLASKAYRNIARRILGENVPLLDIRPKKQSFFSKIRSVFSN